MLSYLLNDEDDIELTHLWQTSPFIYIDANAPSSFLTRWEVFQVAQLLSQQLPEGNFSVILLFQKRHHFLIGLLSTAMSNGHCILPPNLAEQTLINLKNENHNPYLLADYLPCSLEQEFQITEQIIAPLIQQIQNKPVPFDKMALIDTLSAIQQAEIWLYTSGSTGVPKKIIKTWQNMILSAELAIERFQLMQPCYLVATVPSQHMFGLETTIFWPLFSKASIWFERQIFPEDILASLNTNTKHPACLVSTPLHLKNILAFGLDWPKHLTRILSATAPLSVALAKQIESVFNATVFEVYGSTETASIASRQTIHSKNWHAYKQVEFQYCQQKTSVKTPGLVSFQCLNDQIEQIDGTHFKLGKRDSDLIKVAGKRASLAQLNQYLQNIAGVSEAVFIQPKSSERLTAFVVSTLSQAQILSALRQTIDPVFLPRPLRFIEALPRNEVGKVMYNQLLLKLNT